MTRGETRALYWDYLARRLSGEHGAAVTNAVRELNFIHRALASELEVAYGPNADRNAVCWQDEAAAIDALTAICDARCIGRKGVYRRTTTC